MPIPTPVCTRVCTSNENAQKATPPQVSSDDEEVETSPTDPLALLTAAIASLFKSGQAKLVAILTQMQNLNSKYY